MPANLPEGPRSPRTALNLLTAVTPLLHNDLANDIADLSSDIRNSTPEAPGLEAFTAHLKFAIQSFFGLAEATTNSLASAALGSMPAIPNVDMAVLLERDYDEELDKCLDTSRRYSLVTRSQVAFRSFLLACGAPPRPNWNDEILSHFKSLTHARNMFTHPKKFEYLSPAHSFESFRQLRVWFPTEVMHTLAGAARRLGISPPPIPSDISVPPASVIFPDPSTILDEGFYNHIFSTPWAAIAYIDRFSQALHADLNATLSFCRAALVPPYQEQHIGRAVRRAIRVIATTAEGELGFASFFMRAVRRRNGKISVPIAIKGEHVLSRLARTLSAFSTAFGSDFQPATRGQSWEALNTVFSLRDRLIHPRRPIDVDLKVEHLSTAMTALDWLAHNSFPALWLNETKTSDLIGMRRPPPIPSLQRTTPG